MSTRPPLESDGTGIFLVIPVKRSIGSKQRLASELPDGVRQLVSRALASRMVRCAAEGWAPSRVVVVGDDPEVTELCSRLGLATLPDAGGGQSDAVRTGQTWCLDREATTLATVAADLPRVEASDLRRLWETAAQLPPNSLALIPDRSGTGTNGLVLNPADSDPFLFGPDSLRRHREIAQQLGLQLSILDLPRLAWDIDRPEDLLPPSPRLGEGAHPVVAWAKEVADLEPRTSQLEAGLGW
ncbi:MAG TPA: 2-phospho-L-lactate guanylyltransferase [Candidatus Dormibacteraeota bacterium]|nr:2-phospho-L-lactate guanylyltransferase [Candidatus Dormibacteraeota bacterium]